MEVVQRVTGGKRHTLLSVRMGEWGNITTPPAGLPGEQRDSSTVLYNGECEQRYGVQDIVGLIETDTAGGVNVWIGLSWTRL